MKRMMIVGACLLVLVLISAPLVMGGQMPMGGQGEQEQRKFRSVAASQEVRTGGDEGRDVIAHECSG